jgi:hypothetical protein
MYYILGALGVSEMMTIGVIAVIILLLILIFIKGISN